MQSKAITMTRPDQLVVPEVFVTWHPQRDLTEEDADLVRRTLDVPEVTRYYCAVENLDKYNHITFVHFHIAITFNEPVLIGRFKARVKDAWNINFAGMRGGNKTELKIQPLTDFYRVIGGYATKRDSTLFMGPSKNIDVVALKQGNEEYLEMQATRQPDVLTRHSVLHKAFVYRRKSRIESDDLLDVLSRMVKDGYCLSGLCGQYKTPRQYLEIFRKRCHNEPFTPREIESEFFQEWS